MKRFFFPVLIFIIFSLLLFGCQKAAIENAIDDFENAINESDVSALDSVISSDSQMRTGGPSVLETFMDQFDEFRPIDFSGIDIEQDGSDATAYADADYYGTAIDAKFIMKRDEAFFAFLFPDWKVKEYWDTNNPDDELVMVWQKIKSLLKKRKLSK